jgi:ribonuclease Z
MKDDKHYFTLATEHFTIEGRSRAGHETWFRIRELNIALDVGRCPDVLVSVPNLFVTHAHLDHSVGIPFYAGQRYLQRMATGHIHVPAEAADDFRTLMAIHTRLEGTGYDIEFIGMKPGDVVRLGRTHRVRAHRATHRVPALAYEVLETRHHLKPEYAGHSGAELAALRQSGVEVAVEADHPQLIYTGDTDRGILETMDALFRSDVLMIECSFVMPGDEVRAEMYKHIHFDDIAEFADRFENQLVVLTHFSRRYSREEIQRELRRRCPAVLRDRIRLAFPEPYQRL